MRNPMKRIIVLLLILLSVSILVVETSLPPGMEIILATATALTTQEAAPPTSSPAPPTAPARTRYTLNATLDYAGHTVHVDESIVYLNVTPTSLNELVLAVVPNLWTGSFILEGISVNGIAPAAYTITDQRLDLSLPSPLTAGESIKVEIQYSLSLPFAEQQGPEVSRPRIYGYTARQINLTNWYPFVVPFINGEWILHKPWYYGEHLVYDTADYVVNVQAAESSPPLVIASSGAAEQIGNSIRFTISAARTFALSASPDFQVAHARFGDVLISSYYFPIDDTGGKAALQAASEAMDVYTRRFGPYPHQTLAIVMGDFNDGMEYSAFFYLSKDFYNLYDGTYANYLTFVAAHETAHQWWFESVASDQALQPWLDESLTTYSERIYYETAHPDLLDWWWIYRINFYNPQGFVDIPVYDGEGFRPYTDAVYFQGALFLEKMRAQIGEEAFFAFLQDYFAQGNGRIVTAHDFFRILRQHTSVDLSILMQEYFQTSY